MNDAKARSGWVIIPDWTRSRSIGYVADARLGRINSAYLAKRRHTQTVLSGTITHPELSVAMFYNASVMDYNKREIGMWKNGMRNPCNI